MRIPLGTSLAKGPASPTRRMSAVGRLARALGVAGLAFAAQACVVRETTPVNSGYGYHGYAQVTPAPAQVTASVSVGDPSPSYVSSLPPEPLYESMTPAPGYGYVWIDGSWHWNGYEWVWIGGQWVQGYNDYVYVSPYYGYADDNISIIYYPGHWSRPERAPRHWRVIHSRDGRPPRYVPPRDRPRPPRVVPAPSRPTTPYPYPAPSRPTRPPVGHTPRPPAPSRPTTPYPPAPSRPTRPPVVQPSPYPAPSRPTTPYPEAPAPTRPTRPQPGTPPAPSRPGQPPPRPTPPAPSRPTQPPRTTPPVVVPPPSRPTPQRPAPQPSEPDRPAPPPRPTPQPPPTTNPPPRPQQPPSDRGRGPGHKPGTTGSERRPGRP
jgi:hypothetical protein